MHLDLIGGLAGDMFVAALLDAFPQHEPAVQDAVATMSGRFPVRCTLVPHIGHGLRGARFEVMQRADAHPAGGPQRAWNAIRRELDAAALAPPVRKHAIAIFDLLAGAEAAVHGMDPSLVHFHEVGAWDSIADVVAAAALIDAVKATRWTSSPVPLGSGRVNTAHGILPVPAPATVRLLAGRPTLDDGIGGERVTPTGAALLCYLCDADGAPPLAEPRVRTLKTAGIGFGVRSLAGVANHVRLLCFDTPAPTLPQRRLHVLEFDLDDQSPEDLAAGLDRLRAVPGVLDVTQATAFGKKGRIVACIRVLVRAAHLEPIIEACFRETTTIGLRHHSVCAVGLERSSHTVQVDDRVLRVKVVERPGGRTAKTESDDVAGHVDHADRARLRAHAEQEVLRTLRETPVPS